LAKPYIEKAGIDYGTVEALAPVLALAQPKIKHLSDLPSWVLFFFTEEFPIDPEAAEKVLQKAGAKSRIESLIAALKPLPEWRHGELEATLKSTAATLEVKAGELVHPARVAVSGRSVGPGLYEMLELLGKDRVLARLARAAAQAA